MNRPYARPVSPSSQIVTKFPSRCKDCNGAIPPGTTVKWGADRRIAHLTYNECLAKRQAQLQQDANALDAIKLDLTPIVDFLNAAKTRGLKRPKLRVLAPDGKTELQVGLTTSGVAPGSLSVVLGLNYIGCIRPTKQATGEFSRNVKLQQHLLEVAKDPVQAARDYAALKCACSFCGLPLTDAGSVEVGYGPICAKHWGLPHQPKGTPMLKPVTGSPNAQPQQLGLLEGRK